MSETRCTPLFLVEWIDSCGVTNSWCHLSDMADQKAVSIKSIGWVINDNPVFLSIAPNMSECDDDPQVMGVMTIPKVAITKMTRLD